MSNLRNTQSGTFRGDVLFKVRRISTGLYFKPEYRNPKWEDGGRAYKTIHAARTAAGSAREGYNQPIPQSDLEIVEFHIQEVTTHNV